MKSTNIQIIGLIIFTFFSGKFVSGQDTGLDLENFTSTESAYIWKMIDTELDEQVREMMRVQRTEGNVSYIVQVGNNNSATVKQEGARNYSGILQTGNYNESELSLYGNGNFAIIEQLGSFNTATKTIEGNDTEFFLFQKGNGLEFSIQGDLPSGSRITQEGTRMQIQIK